MNIRIKVGVNKSATLITDDGIELFSFHSLTEALLACRDWYRCYVNEILIEETLAGVGCIYNIDCSARL